MSEAKKILIVIMFFSLTCSQVAAKSKYRLKFATMAPKAIGWSMEIRNIFMPAFEKATEGNISIKWYWGGLKGDDIDYVRLMKAGKLDGAALAGHGVTMICPEMSVLGLPFLFQDFDEVDYVRRQMFSKFSQLAEKHGYQFLFWGDQDFDQIYSTQQPIKNIGDFQKVTIAGWYNTPIDMLLIKKLRTNHIPVRSLEINSVLRQKKADAYIGPALWVVGCQLYTLFKYVSQLNMRYSPAALVFTQKAWNKIPKKYHSRIHKLLSENGQNFREKTRMDGSRALKAMKKYGLKSVEISSEEKAMIKKMSQPIWEEATNKVFPESILKEIQRHIQTFRNQ
jgi:TRAP-type C4-dicarboxylate transport system substrate-binding protein